MIRLRNLSRSFRVHKKAPGLWGSVQSLFVREWIEKQALCDVSLDVAEGEIVGLVGANGAGKTTLVKILTGIIHPGQGEVSVGGYHPWDRKDEFRRSIALIMGQKASLWWDLPAEDCFMLLREIYGIGHKEYRTRLDYLTETLDVRSVLNIQIRRLSLGERMKMELIAAFLHQPRIVFLDEPTIGLDLTAQRSIRNFLLDYRKRHRPAILLTSHYMEDIERLCKRIVILREGRLVYDGSLQDIVSEHARHKVLTARLMPQEEGADPANPIGRLEFPARLGRVLSSEGDFLEVQVARQETAAAADFLLRNHNVVDLNVVEQDIGEIIESIIRRQTGTAEELADS